MNSSNWHKVLRLYQSGTLRLAVEGEVGNWIAAVGEKLGSEGLMFNRMMFSGFHRGALETAPAATGLLELHPELRTAVDLGCGTGVYLHELKSRGLQVTGYEYSARARRVAKQLYDIDVLPFDLSNFAGPAGQSDVCLCIEIAHYLPADLGNALVRHCSQSAPLALFSAAHPGQHGYGHINAQPRSYWIDRFEKQGMRFNQVATARMTAELSKRLERGFWLAENICIFER